MYVYVYVYIHTSKKPNFNVCDCCGTSKNHIIFLYIYISELYVTSTECSIKRGMYIVGYE